MQIGIDSFIATLADPVTGALYDPVVRLQNLLEEVELADRVSLDAFGIGEHHREEFLDSAPVVRAGMLGLPLMIAIIGGEPHRFRPLVDLYRKAGLEAGHSPESLKVGIHAVGYVADTDSQAADDFFPGFARMFTEIGKERG